VAAPDSNGTAVMTRPTTIVQKPTLFSIGCDSGRRSPFSVVRLVNPTMKNVVHTSALRTPWRVRPW
jgi:hypothetical protein